MGSYHIFGINFKINDFYSIDDKNAYWNGNKIERADLDSFKILHQFWAMDKKNCYQAYFREENINRETFEPLNYFLAKDKFIIWNGSEKIIGMDAEPFNFWKYLKKLSELIKDFLIQLIAVQELSKQIQNHSVYVRIKRKYYPLVFVKIKIMFSIIMNRHQKLKF